ncbi:MAG TPA: TIGR03013 family XrtA/PEP-CTERM system glycosyltransferase [Vicinamibacterales bacterium]|nr:TIGR03013 family XrtA/PEP-CTERM system glycosyltransferase [Vicinamibacterales bacterium]
MAKGLLQEVTWRSTTLVVAESALIVSAVTMSAFLRLGMGGWELLAAGTFIPRALLVAYVCQLCLYYNDLYDQPRLAADLRDLLVRILQALGASSIILAAVYFWFPNLIIGQGVFAGAAMLVATTVIGWRLAFAWTARLAAPRERLLLVGTNQAAVALARELEGHEDLGIEIVGFIDPDGGATDADVIGTIDDIPAVVRARGVDRVVVSLADARGRLPMEQLLEMKLSGVTFDHLASVYEEYTGKIAVENLRPSWFIFSPGFRKTRALLVIKRALDIVVAIVGLALSFPLLVLLAAAVKASSPGPAFYRQARVGQSGRVFSVCKLRSMRQDAEAGTGPVWARQNDNRVTSLGRFMRRTRLDELPQLWTVLCGNMSFVGPRPERPEFVRSLTQQIPFYGQRHVVKPGLTGWAQVRYTYGASVEDAIEKLQYDLYYVKHLSVWFDLIIILETIKTVVSRAGH